MALSRCTEEFAAIAGRTIWIEYFGIPVGSLMQFIFSLTSSKTFRKPLRHYLIALSVRLETPRLPSRRSVPGSKSKKELLKTHFNGRKADFVWCRAGW